MEAPTTGDPATGDVSELVLQLGDPRLRWPCKEIADARSPDVRDVLRELHETLAICRAATGFGRALAAPQIGRRLRVVAFDLGDGPRALLNPRIVGRSRETFTLWDDCFSFPDRLVRVRRARSITLEYVDETGHHQEWRDLDPPEAELFQHELDHLDGVLALDRAVDAEAVVTRAEFERDRERLEALADQAS